MTTPSRRHRRVSSLFEIDVADAQPPVAAEERPANAVFPSARCANREEWQGECRLWSGKPHNRYLEFKRLNKGEGIGANLMRIAWALNRAISFDLEPIFIGPFRAGHGAGDFGDWVGITQNRNPLLVIQDPAGFSNATNEVVPFPEGDGDDWFREQENRTSVIYKVKPIKVHKIKDWGMPVSRPNSDPRVCPYVRQALRNIYWSAPPTRGRCHTMLPDDRRTQPEDAEPGTTTGSKRDGKRPWVVAVHVRRGDMIHFRGGRRSIPHRYFSVVTRSILQGIAATDPAANVSVLVFSEGPETLQGLQLHDEKGKAVTWDIKNESCVDIGLNCTQVRNIIRQITCGNT